MVESDEDAATGATRKGDRAWYFWQYPNFMINCYAGYMDTNLVVPLDTDRCRVIFDFYFDDVSEAAAGLTGRVFRLAIVCRTKTSESAKTSSAA